MMNTLRKSDKISILPPVTPVMALKWSTVSCLSSASSSWPRSYWTKTSNRKNICNKNHSQFRNSPLKKWLHNYYLQLVEPQFSGHIGPRRLEHGSDLGHGNRIVDIDKKSRAELRSQSEMLIRERLSLIHI